MESAPLRFVFTHYTLGLMGLQVQEKSSKKVLTYPPSACIIIQVANGSGKRERVSYNIKESLDWPLKILKKKF